MARSSARRPDPLVLQLAAIHGCDPTPQAVVEAAQRSADRDPQVLTRRSELRQLLRELRAEERAERLIGDREAAEVCGVRVRTWQSWCRELPSLAALAEPGPGPRRWRLSVIQGWRP